MKKQRSLGGQPNIWLRSLICMLETVYVHILVCLVSLSVIIAGFYSFKEDPEKVSALFAVGSHSLVFFHAVKAIHFVVYRKKDVKKLQSKVQTIAQRLLVKSSSLQMNSLIIIGLVIQIGCYILLWQFIVLSADELVFEVLPYLIAICYMYMCIAQLGVYLILPERCLHSMRGIVLSSMDRVKNYGSFDVLVGYYDVLLEYCESVNQWFDEQLLLNAGFCIFGLLREITRLELPRAFGVEDTKPAMKLEITINITLYALILTSLILICYKVTDKAAKFNKSLSSLAMRDQSGKIASSPYIQAHFAASRKLQFSVFGIFCIDRHFGRTILVLISTYVLYFKR